MGTVGSRRWGPKNHHPRGNQPYVKKPPCPEGAVQVSPGQSDAAQPRCATLGKRPTPHVRHPEGQRCKAFFSDGNWGCHARRRMKKARFPPTLTEHTSVRKESGYVSQEKQARRLSIRQRLRAKNRPQNAHALRSLVEWLIPPGGLFHKGEFHGNIKWSPESLAGPRQLLRGSVGGEKRQQEIWQFPW